MLEDLRLIVKHAVGSREVVKQGCVFWFKEKKVRLVARRRRRRREGYRIRGIFWRVWNDLFCGDGMREMVGGGGESIGTTMGYI